MTLLDKITEKVLAQIDDTGFTQSGAFNLRHNGIALCHGRLCDSAASHCCGAPLQGRQKKGNGGNSPQHMLTARGKTTIYSRKI